MSQRVRATFLFDVDNTLLDNDRVTADLRRHLTGAFGAERQEHYWHILDRLRRRRGYTDYLGALQRYRAEDPCDPQFIQISFFLLDYPFADRIYPGALDTLRYFSQWGPTVIFSDGDVVFQPHKIKRSGLYDAVEGRVVLSIHKEQQLDDVQKRYPADHYVLVDDKLRIHAAVKQAWRHRVTTVFVRQGHYALDPQIVAEYPAADLSVDQVTDLMRFDLPSLLGTSPGEAASPSTEPILGVPS